MSDPYEEVFAELRNSLQSFLGKLLTSRMRAQILFHSTETLRKVNPTVRVVLVEDKTKPGCVDLMRLEDWHKLVEQGKTANLCATMMGQT